MADMKTTIIKSMENGAETLTTIEERRKTGIFYNDAPAETSRTIDALHRKSIELKVKSAYMNTDKSRTIRLVSADESPLPVFESGQYINIFATIDGVRTSRPYSISSPSTCRDYYEITAGRIPENGFFSDFLIDKVKEGDFLQANGPAGTFHYHPVFHKDNQVFIAGGTGITPFMSMTREVLENNLNRNIHLIYGVANTGNMLFRDELYKMAEEYHNFTFTPVYSEPEEGWTGHTGFVTCELLKELVCNIDDSTFYLCGPQVMNASVEKSLLELGAKKSMIRREMFSQNQGIHRMPGWPEGLDPDEEFNITVHYGHDTKTVKGKAKESLLVTLERHGIRVNVCCRSGECSMCRVKLKDGNVFIAQGSLQRRADEKFGYVHSCKAYPISDVEIIL